MARHQFYELTEGGEPTLVSPSGTHSGVDITIQNLGPGFVFIGGSNVSTGSFGFLLPPFGAWSVELPPKDSLYVIGATNPDEAFEPSEEPGSPVAYVAVLSVSLEYQK
jgi:hypothetical protein